MNIGNRQIGGGKPCYIIAEIGSNHNQDLSMANELIEAAAKCGADAVKFQTIKFEKLYKPSEETDDFAKLIKSLEVPDSWYPELIAHAKKHNVDFSSSPTYLEAVDTLYGAGVDFFKIASPQTVGFPYIIEYAATKGKPLVISTGYCKMDEIKRAVELCRNSGNDNFALLHCVSKYPTKPDEANLRIMDILRDNFHCPVGFSDHTMSVEMGAIAVAAGASILEKHITLDRNQKGPDHKFALEPDEFREYVSNVREAKSALGKAVKAVLSEEEDVKKRMKFDVKLIAKNTIREGEEVTLDKLDFRRTKEGISSLRMREILGKKLKKTVEAGEPIREGNLHG